MASRPALAALPMATVATGTPLGIWGEGRREAEGGGVAMVGRERTGRAAAGCAQGGGRRCGSPATRAQRPPPLIAPSSPPRHPLLARSSPTCTMDSSAAPAYCPACSPAPSSPPLPPPPHHLHDGQQRVQAVQVRARGPEGERRGGAAEGVLVDVA
jgi:hypothetical protein